MYFHFIACKILHVSFFANNVEDWLARGKP